MSKRASSDFNSQSSKPTKRAKKSLDTSDQDSVDTSSFYSTSELLPDKDHFIKADQDQWDDLVKKVNNIFKKTPNEEKINELTSLFKDIINSKNQNEKSQLNNLFLILIEYLCNNSIGMDDKLVAQTSSLLSLQIDSLDLNVLKQSIAIFLSQIKKQMPFNEKCMEMFVELFKYLKSQQEQFSGNEFVLKKVDELFTYRWIQSTAINVLNLIKHLSLNPSQIKNLISKLFDLNEIEWPSTQIPNLINSVLSLSNKQNRTFIFEQILTFFRNLRDISKSMNESSNNSMMSQRASGDYNEAELLSILHIIHLVKTDQNAGKDLIKTLKLKLTNGLIELVQPFTFSLILALIKAFPQKELVLDGLLKPLLHGIYESELKWKQHYWISKCLSSEDKKLSQLLLRPSKCRLLSTEAILPGLILFLFDLLDTNGVRIIKTSKTITLKEHLTMYASMMIRDLFRSVPIARDEILDQLTERIFSSTVTKSAIFIDQLTILIQSEPAASFRNYFAKFKGRLDHMIYMTPVISLEFLKSIKPLLKYDSVYKDNLITTLKKSIYQSDLAVRKVGLNGLICLLNTTKLTNFLPSSQASQSMNLSQSQSQISSNRSILSQEKQNEKNCLEIFQSLRRCLTQQSEIRSKLYQSSSSLIVQNPTLVGPVLNLLLTHLENYLIKADMDTLLDMSKCLKMNDSSNTFELIEPIDVLLHSLHLCDDKYIKMDLQSKFQDQLDEDIKKHSDLIKTYFEKLKMYLLQQSGQYLIDTYKSQIVSLYLSNKQSNNIMKQTQQKEQQQNEMISNNLYQCLLGTYEALMEHFFSIGSLKSMRDMYKKFSQLYDVTHKQTANEETAKKKPPAKKPPKGKKGKDKENKSPNETKANIIDDEDDIRASATDNTMSMLDLTSNNSVPVLESTKNHAAKAKPKKPSPEAKFNYVHRLSYTCIVKLLKLYFADDLKKVEDLDSNDEAISDFLMQLRLDDNFLNYLLKVLNQQLDFMLNESNNVKMNDKPNQAQIYDCESYNDQELFNYLFQLWTLFWNQMSSSECRNRECDQSYCEECIKLKLNYVKILNHIWKIVFLKFSPKLDSLFSYSVLTNSQESINQTTSQSDTSTVAVGILDLCRHFINKCLLNNRIVKTNSFKLASNLIDLMHDVGSIIELQMTDFNVLFKWTQNILVNEENNDITFVKSVIRFFTYITWNKNSSATLIKYICQDFTHILGVSAINKSISSQDQVFVAINHDCLMTLMGPICNEITNILNVFEWFISFKSDPNSMMQLYKQLQFILESLKYILITIDSLKQHHETLIRLFTRFYTFMILLCKSVLSKNVGETPHEQFKQVVDSTAKNLQTALNQFIRKIQNAKAGGANGKNGEEKKGGKSKGGKDNDNTLTSARILKCVKMIPNLVYSIEQYEQHLKLLNKHFLEKIDFTENFELCLRDFRILLPTEESNTQLESINGDSDNDSNSNQTDSRVNNSMGNQDDDDSNDRQTTERNDSEEEDQDEDD